MAAKTQSYPTIAAVEAALDGLSAEQRGGASVAQDEHGRWVVTLPEADATALGAPIPAADILAYAEARQADVLARATVSVAASGGMLTTHCDPTSVAHLNSLGGWSARAGAADTRTYVCLDYSAVKVTPADVEALLSAVDARVQATYDVLAQVRAGTAASPPTVRTRADVAAAPWPGD